MSGELSMDACLAVHKTSPHFQVSELKLCSASCDWRLSNMHSTLLNKTMQPLYAAPGRGALLRVPARAVQPNTQPEQVRSWQ